MSLNKRVPLIALFSAACLAAAALILAFHYMRGSIKISADQPLNTPPQQLDKKSFRLSVLAFQPENHGDHKENRYFSQPTMKTGTDFRTFRLHNSEKDSAVELTYACVDVDLEKANRRNSDFRAGFTELNETRENANKISLSRIKWLLSCQQNLLVADGEVRHPFYGVFSIRLSHDGAVGFRLKGIHAARTPDTDRQFAISALELRTNEQRRGQTLSQGIKNSSLAIIAYDADSISEQAANDISNLYHNSEWLDLSLRRGTKKILLSLELPVLREPPEPIE